MAETFYAGDKVRKYYAKGDISALQEKEYYDMVATAFPWLDEKSFVAISTPVLHPVLKQNFVSCLLPAGQTKILFDSSIHCAARKFNVENKKSYIRAYKILLENELPNLTWLPANCNVLAIGENYAEFGRACPNGIETFKDYYFSGDPDIVETQFQLERRRGNYETYYGATCINNEVIEIKQYCYDDQQFLSDWDVYAMLGRREREVGGIGKTELNEEYSAARDILNNKVNSTNI